MYQIWNKKWLIDYFDESCLTILTSWLWQSIDNRPGWGSSVIFEYSKFIRCMLLSTLSPIHLKTVNIIKSLIVTKCSAESCTCIVCSSMLYVRDGIVLEVCSGYSCHCYHQESIPCLKLRPGFFCDQLVIKMSAHFKNNTVHLHLK